MNLNIIRLRIHCKLGLLISLVLCCVRSTFGQPTPAPERHRESATTRENEADRHAVNELLASRFQRSGTRVTFGGNVTSAVICIDSDEGIDRGKIHRRTDRWPARVVVRLHLRGLENFQVSTPIATLKWHVATSAPNCAGQTLIQNGREIDLDNSVANPWRAEVQICNASPADSSTLPLRDRYFEITLPARLFQSNPEAIEFQWVDFYR